ncbi:hypothetical protein [Alkalicoccobacillus gibsonii]|uniref:hypothetical protein n=1 Tax=Alkalicoccobacillus gibsonii TaxID=79881 RepID=UPI001AED813B|nr:hypothetical protein [Alkalicoccobacillus gibsonii]
MMIASSPGEASCPTKPGEGEIAYRHKVAECARYQHYIVAILPQRVPCSGHNTRR